jgi:hypothetical protein
MSIDVGKRYITVGASILVASLALFIFGTWLTLKYTRSDADIVNDINQTEIRTLSETNRGLIEQNGKRLEEIKKELAEIKKRLTEQGQ